MNLPRSVLNADVAKLDIWRDQGHHAEPWDGCNAAGDPLPAGVYCYLLTTWMVSRERKMAVIRRHVFLSSK